MQLILFLKKIRALNMVTKSAAKISNMLQKDFIHLGLDQKKSLFLQTSLDRYIKAVSYCYFFLSSLAY